MFGKIGIIESKNISKVKPYYSFYFISSKAVWKKHKKNTKK